MDFLENIKSWVASRISSKPRTTGWFVFLLSLFLTMYLSYAEYQLKLSLEREEVVYKLNELENRLGSALNNGISAVKTLGFYAQNQENIVSDFEKIGKEILDSNPLVDVIQYLDSGTIVAVYPLEGNEVVIGYDVLADSTNNKEVMEAIRRKEVFFSGPIRLKQGGSGIVGRYPLFREGKLQGLSAIIIYVDTIFEEGLLRDDSEGKFSVQLSKRNPNSGEIENFLPKAKGSGSAGFVASTPIDVGNWVLTVQLNESTAFSSVLFAISLRILLSVALGFVSWSFARQPSLLLKKLNEKTDEILLANERFELATKATSDGIWDWDLEKNEKYRSSQFAALFGYKEEEFNAIKQFRTDLIHPDDLERVQTKLQQTLASDSSYWQIEFRARKADQTYAYVSEKGFIVRNEQGKAIRMIGATQNITQQKTDELKLIQANERFELATRATSDVIWDWDLESNQVYRSEQFDVMFGYEDQEKIKSSDFWKSIIHPEDFPTVDRELKETLEGTAQFWQKEFRVKRADHTYAFIIDKGYIMRDADGKAYRMIGSIQDISSRKENELKLLEANQRLSNANEELKVFASLASHDMREPLRMISSFMSLLEKKYGENLDEKARQYISFAMDGAKRLTLLINDLLDYSKVGFDQKLIEEINTEEIVTEVLELKSAIIRENEATIDFENLPTIKGVKIPMKVLFQNLIGNALKYKKTDAKPQIKISGKELKDFWEFYIEDNGIGIEPDYLELIFGILKRLHPKEKYPGTGMGLATCRKIITQHGGRIWAESTPEIGSKFFFTIKKHEQPTY